MSRINTTDMSEQARSINDVEDALQWAQQQLVGMKLPPGDLLHMTTICDCLKSYRNVLVRMQETHRGVKDIGV